MKVYAADDDPPPPMILNSPPPSVTSSSLHKRRNKVDQFFNKHLSGKTSSSDFSESWRQKFMHHPSWCDADMCIQQINLGNASGNRIALYGRSFFQRLLFQLGDFVQNWPKLVIFFGFFFLSICLIGIKDVTIEVDLVKLWVEQGGRLDEELAFFGNSRTQYYANQHHRHRRSSDLPEPIKPVVTNRPPPSEIPSDAGLSGGFQVVIQTPEVESSNILTKEALLRHVKILEEIARFEVEMFGETWGLADICFKPPAPRVPKNNILASYQYIFDKLIPCIWITPADCFWDASKVLGPYPSVNLNGVQTLLPHLPQGNLSWRTLDPELLLEDLSLFKELVGGINEAMESLFKRAGVGNAYQKRLCIDPLDYECPKASPNYFDRCSAFRKFLQWNNKQPKSHQVHLTAEKIEKGSTDADVDLSNLIGRRRKRQESEDEPVHFTATTQAGNGTSDGSSNDYYDDSSVNDVKSSTVVPEAEEEKKFSETCESYARSFLQWMDTVGHTGWEFLNESVFINNKEVVVEPPSYPNYGNVLTNGCKGFGQNIMNWPEDLIVGGIRRENGLISHAEAFQSVFLVAAAGDVYQRFKNKDLKEKPNLDLSTFSVSHAGAIIQAWQRSFTDRLYDHPINNNKRRKEMEKMNRNSLEGTSNTSLTTLDTAGLSIETIESEEEQVRIIHPLASTSIQDMLKEFSEFQFFVIFMGYALMILYAGFTQFDWDGWWFSVRSNCFLAIIGVLIVTYASFAGLALSAFLGVHFNAATTQIVPFLTLGLGIDDLFLFLHNYNGVLESVKKREVAILVKETGMSILITSSNNILAFLAGIILPIPALRSFCVQTAILLTFNLVCIVIIFPAFVTLDLRRRKAGIRDMMCGCCLIKSVTDYDDSESGNAVKFKIQECSSRNQLIKNGSTASSASLSFQDSVVNYDANAFPLSTPAAIEKQKEANLGVAEILSIPEKEKWYTLEGFLHQFYIPFLMKPWAKVLICLISVFMFGFGCLGLRDSVLGLELADILPENTPPSAFLRAREKYFSFYPIFTVLKNDVDYPRQQDTIEQLRLDIGKSNFVIKGDTILRHIQEPSEHYWIWYMRQWLKSIQSAVDKALDEKQINAITGAMNKSISTDAAIGRRLLCSVGNVYNCTGRMNIKMLDENGVINRESFYNYLTAWYNVDNMMYYVSQGQIFPPPPAWAFSEKEDILVPPAEPIIYSQIPFYMTGLTDTPAIVKMIEEIRSICEHYTNNLGLPVFPIGIPFTFWEQYLHLTDYLFSAILTIGVTVLLIISIIIFNPWAAAMVAVVVVSMTVELGGFMGLFGVKMNPISAVTLITAVGIGVEFTAHVVLAFLTSLGSRNDRMISCLEHMFVPVVHGVLSTLLGIIMLAFSEFDFVVKYFFVVMTALILLGLFNGLAMLPVMLSLIGPPCEVYPIDGGKELACPPPLDRKRFKNGAKLKKLELSANNFVVSETTETKKPPDSPTSINGVSSPSPPTSVSSVEGGSPHVYHDSLSTLHETDESRGNSVSIEQQQKQTPRSDKGEGKNIQRF